MPMKSIFARWIPFLLAAGWTELAVGATSDAAGSLGDGLPGMGSSVVRLLGAFALVVALMFVGVWLTRNWQRFAGRKSGTRKLSVVDVRMIGNRQSVFVLGYESQRFLVASTPSGMSLLAHLPSAEETAAEAAPEAPERMGFTPVFAEAFQQALGRRS